jgi:glycosyltransferase involved in cell wall biosynthesis
MKKGSYNNGHNKELDPSKRAQRTLDTLLSEGENPEDITVVDERLVRLNEERRRAAEVANAEPLPDETVEVTEALHGERMLTRSSSRSSARLLIFTRDESLLEEGSPSDRRMRETAGLFGEVHVVLLLEGRRKQQSVRRGHNLWLYLSPSFVWWMNVFKAQNVAKEQLMFANGFHADIVIAEDPFESGVAAYQIASEFNRPFQLHLRDDIFSKKQFADAAPNNNWRLFLANYTMHRVSCVRVASEYLKQRVVDSHRGLEEFTEVLPEYYNLQAWQDAAPAFDLHARYPQFKFIILHISNMHAKSNTDRAILGISRVLKRHASVGLVVVGEGKEQSLLQKHVIKLGLQNQVVFEPKPADVTSHMKTANVLLFTSASSDDEGALIHAGTVELPIVSAVEGLAGELFVDGISAFLCPTDSPPCFGEKVNRLLNDNTLRVDMAMRAKETVFSRIEQDYGTYLESYKASIERCLAA